MFSFCSAAARTLLPWSMVVYSALAVPLAAENFLPKEVDFKNAKCNAAFTRYLSCFSGENMKTCVAKVGKKVCEAEYSAVRGDLALSWSIFSVLDQPGCSPETYKMIEHNLKNYVRDFGCKPR